MIEARAPLFSALRATLVWFAAFGRPTRKDEARKYLFQYRVSEAEWDHAVSSLTSNTTVAADSEYFFPTQQQEIARHFRRHDMRRQKYLRRAAAAARLLARLPFVRLVALINSLVMGDIDDGSDIDLFIITAPRRLYIVRTLALILLTVCGLKKTRTKIAGKICLGFFVTEEAIDFEKEKIGCDPVYLAFWLATMQPLAGDARVYAAFMARNLPFVQHYLPNFTPEHSPLPRFPVWQRCGEFLLHGWLGRASERMLARIHIRHTWKLPENHWATATTIANERMLKLHAVDRTRQYRQEWEETTMSWG